MERGVGEEEEPGVGVVGALPPLFFTRENKRAIRNLVGYGLLLGTSSVSSQLVS